MRQSRFRSLLGFTSPLPVTLVATLCTALAGCSGETKGQVILALQTDMAMPSDVTKVKIEVKADGVSRYDNIFIVDPNAKNPDKIPATLSVVAGEKESETIELKIVALRPKANGNGDEPRTLNKTITTIPKERIAMLRVPMQWLCTNSDDDPDDDDSSGDFITDLGDGEYESACDPTNGKETACVAGGCKNVHLDSSKLPDFSEKAVFGGDDSGSDGTCFPTEDCFDAGVDITADVDRTDCTVAYEPESDEILNFAVLANPDPAMPGHGGICSSGNCYVGLDKSREAGWYELDDGAGPVPPTDTLEDAGASAPMRAPSGRRFKLPQAVCNRLDSGKAVGVSVSTDGSCLVTKTSQYPTCGPWSSVGKRDRPAGDDADGDGHDSEAAGGDDCDDNDRTTFLGAPERCDELDNDCDEAIDDNCDSTLPDANEVDYTDGDAVSEPNAAVYETFGPTDLLDLDQKTITFAPNADFTRYTVTTAGLEWDDSAETLVPVTSGQQDPSNCDDCYTTLPLDFSFDFFGTEYDTIYPSSNGYLTFVMGDRDYDETVEKFLAGYPRIAALYDDLDSSGPSDMFTDEVRYFSSSSKLVVTYNAMQIFPSSMTSNTFQFVLTSDGTIKISYNGMDDLDRSSIAGITPGSIGGGTDCVAPDTGCFGSCVDLQTDAINCGACGTVCSSNLCTAGECVEGKVCTVSNGECPGTCVGTCSLPGAGPCDGLCYGTCSGTCSQPDGSGGCIGTCSGDCNGTCYLESGGSCPDNCSGDCYVDEAMGCPDPTIGSTGPCVFSGASIVDATTCYDNASTASSAYYTLQCASDGCHCCRGTTMQVCELLATTPATACASEAALRRTLLDECMQNSPCGAGCPATSPGTGAGCNETEIDYCYYPDAATPSYCFCEAGEFACQ